MTRAFTQFVYGDHAATRSMSVGSSPGARELFTRLDTKDRGSKNPAPANPDHPEKDDNRVGGADDGKGKLLSQVG